MTNWEEFKRRNIAIARDAVSNVADRDALDRAFRSWRQSIERDGVKAGSELAGHTATSKLAAALHFAGLKDAAEFVLSDWSPTGPFRLGGWIVAQLIGNAFAAHVFASSDSGAPRTPHFFGCEAMGAWEAFDDAVQTLLQDQSAQSKAFKWLDTLVAHANSTPGDFTCGDTQSREALRRACDDEKARPPIEPEWEHRLDVVVPLVWAIAPLLRIDPKRTLAKLADFPHPTFICGALPSCLDEFASVDLAALIEASPPAFDADGSYLSSGAVVVELLSRAGAAIRRKAKGADGRLPTAAMGDTDGLRPAAEALQAEINPIIDGIFSRDDAVPLAWCWLERLIFEDARRGLWTCRDIDRSQPTAAPMLVLNPLGLLVESVCLRLQLRPDWKSWADQKKSLWRIDRLTAAILVAPRSTAPAEIAVWLRNLLLGDAIEVAAAEQHVTRGGTLIEIAGGCALVPLPDCAEWFTRTWQALRAKRERSWDIDADQTHQDASAQLLIIWGLGSLRYLPAGERQAMWAAVERALRDAKQTDANSGIGGSFWVAALRRLFSHLDRRSSAAIYVTLDELSELLFPYVEADAAFTEIILALNDGGWQSRTLSEVVSHASGDMSSLIEQYVEFDAMRRKEHAKISRLHELLAHNAGGSGSQPQ